MRKAAVTPWLVAALFGGTTAQVAATQPATASSASPLVVHLEVDAQPDCTTGEALAARVAARSARIRFADDAAVAVRVTVARARGGRTVAAGLTVTRPDAPVAVRRITANSCDQVSEGLALVIALALDPESPEAPAAPPVAVAKPSSPPPALREAASPAPAGGGTARTVWGADAGAEVIVGPAPGAMPGIRVGARLTRDRARSAWSPALVVSVVHAWTGELGEPGGTAAFTLNAANLDVCPVRLAALDWEARACGSVLAGRLRAMGSNTYSPASASRPFAAGGASLLLAVGVGRRLVIAARLEALASWIRDAYTFSPTVFHRASAVTLAGGLSLGLRFR